MLLLAFLCALYMGWSMGANDAANCVGADIGSGVMSVRTGIVLTCVFCFLGAVLLGGQVIKTIGKGIVPLASLPHQQAMTIAFAAVFGAASWVTLATYLKFPVSTSHAIVGGVAGAGLACHTVVLWEKMSQIVICWIVTPLGSAIFALVLYPFLAWIFGRPAVRKIGDRLIVVLIYLTSMYLAFTWGGNDVANATGLLTGTGKFSAQQAAVIGAAAILLGVVTWGHRVIETIGFQITNLTPLMTVAAEIASSVNVHLYTLWGIPVSTSHSIVGAIFGVGLATGIKALNLRLVRDIFVTWAVTPVVAGAISWAVVKLVVLFM
ncbi:MAG TPA: inorganic phosphate transporter [bacterium]|nr:inorganic phosphate transporter [bacterium]HPP11799.1 inorganic phosphate transporter [bacterium]